MLSSPLSSRTQPAPSPGQTSGGPSIPSAPTPTSPSSDPTDMPLALLPPERQLTKVAKAGIAVSVTVFCSALLLGITIYIRRLKRQLVAAQAQAQSLAAAAMYRGRSPPISPLSPNAEMYQHSFGDSIAGVVGAASGGRKSHGHVLSVVVERAEDDEPTWERIAREPVPGQKEGLVDPLELDGASTGLIELPTSVTPRTRSRERS